MTVIDTLEARAYALTLHPQPTTTRIMYVMQAFDLPGVAPALFGGADKMQEWEATGTLEVEGVATSFELMRDAASHAKYPFTRCPAYVVHGEQDQVWMHGCMDAWKGRLNSALPPSSSVSCRNLPLAFLC